MDLKDWQKIEEEKQVIRKMRKMYMFKGTDGKMETENTRKERQLKLSGDR